MIGLLQYLAISPLISGSILLSSTPASASLSQPRSHPALARRLRNQGQFEHVKKDIKAKSGSKRIRRRGDGSTCRVRPGQQSASVSAATASATEATASATQVWSSVAASAAVTDSVTQIWSSSEPTPVASSVWSATSASSTWVAPTTSAAATSPNAGTGATMNAGSPLGIAWPNGDWAAPGDVNFIGNYVGNRGSWYYDWHYTGCSKADALGLEYVPMMWGLKDANDDFVNSQSSWPSTTSHVLFFNEPEIGSQSQISASDSVAYWKQYMSPLKAKGYRIGMAAVTSGPAGLQWLKDFRSACQECWDEADFVPLHYYYTSAEDFQTYVTKFHNEVQKPLWVTEYACQNFNNGAQCTWDETMDFHYQMSAWFDAQDYVERYSPFGAMKEMQGVNEMNRLMDAGGAITDLGKWYIYSS